MQFWTLEKYNFKKTMQFKTMYKFGWIYFNIINANQNI